MHVIPMTGGKLKLRTLVQVPGRRDVLTRLRTKFLKYALPDALQKAEDVSQTTLSSR